jgi:hypothetical protein
MSRSRRAGHGAKGWGAARSSGCGRGCAAARRTAGTGAGSDGSSWSTARDAIAGGNASADASHWIRKELGEMAKRKRHKRK